MGLTLYIQTTLKQLLNDQQLSLHFQKRKRNSGTILKLKILILTKDN